MTTKKSPALVPQPKKNSCQKELYSVLPEAERVAYETFLQSCSLYSLPLTKPKICHECAGDQKWEGKFTVTACKHVLDHFPQFKSENLSEDDSLGRYQSTITVLDSKTSLIKVLDMLTSPKIKKTVKEVEYKDPNQPGAIYELTLDVPSSENHTEHYLFSLAVCKSKECKIEDGKVNFGEVATLIPVCGPGVKVVPPINSKLAINESYLKRCKNSKNLIEQVTHLPAGLVDSKRPKAIPCPCP